MTTMIRPDPLFLIYRHRSGSTYLAELLSRHPAVCIAPESNLMLTLIAHGRKASAGLESPAALNEVLTALYREEKLREWAPPQREVAEDLRAGLPVSLADLGRTILRSYCRHKKPAHLVWGIKKGVYLLHLPHLIRLYPRAKILYLVRDGRAVYASSLRARHSQTGEPFERDAVSAACEWVRGTRIYKRHAAKCDALQIAYEELITAPEETLVRILAFLDLPATPMTARAMLVPQQAFELTRNTAHLHQNIHQPPKPERITAWQTELNPQEILDFEAIAHQDLVRAGYACISSTKDLRTRRAALTWRCLRHKLARVYK